MEFAIFYTLPLVITKFDRISQIIRPLEKNLDISRLEPLTPQVSSL